MAQSVLPSSINYDQQLSSLIPGVQNFSYVVQPNNGTKFAQGMTIQCDLGNRGCLDPHSLYIRYRMTVATNATVGGVGAATGICGFPALAPFNRVDTIVGGQLIDSINDYNVVAHTWSNINMSCADKYGLQYNLGYQSTPTGLVTPDLSQFDGRVIGSMSASSSTSYFISVPLVCTKIANCEKFIPLFACPAIRINLTIDNIANFLYTDVPGAIDTANTVISNFELVYDMVDFGPAVEQEILSRESVTIKTSGYNNSSVSVPVGTIGSQQFVFNQRFASIRSALLLPSASSINAVQLNGKFDSVDISTNGTYQLSVGAISFPQAPLNLSYNKAGVMSELRKAVSNLYTYEKGFSINSIEFGYTDSSTTKVAEPGKVYIPFDLNKINSSGNNLLNGTSSQNTPINANINILTATQGGKNLYLVLNYDCILTLDVRNKQISMVQ